MPVTRDALRQLLSSRPEHWWSREELLPIFWSEITNAEAANCYFSAVPPSRRIDPRPRADRATQQRRGRLWLLGKALGGMHKDGLLDRRKSGHNSTPQFRWPAATGRSPLGVTKQLLLEYARSRGGRATVAQALAHFLPQCNIAAAAARYRNNLHRDRPQPELPPLREQARRGLMRFIDRTFRDLARELGGELRRGQRRPQQNELRLPA